MHENRRGLRFFVIGTLLTILGIILTLYGLHLSKTSNIQNAYEHKDIHNRSDTILILLRHIDSLTIVNSYFLNINRSLSSIINTSDVNVSTLPGIKGYDMIKKISDNIINTSIIGKYWVIIDYGITAEDAYQKVQLALTKGFSHAAYSNPVGDNKYFGVHIGQKLSYDAAIKLTKLAKETYYNNAWIWQ